MKIAYLSTFYPFRGGIAQFNAKVYRELEKMNHEVHPLTFTTQYPNFLFPGETQFVKDNDIADAIPAKRILNSANPISWHSTAKQIENLQPDLLLMRYWMSYFGPSHGYIAGKLKEKTKIITILDNVIPHEKKFFDKAFTKYFVSKSHGFIAMSEKVKQDLLSFVPDANIILTPHPLYDHFGKKIDKAEAQIKLGLDPTKKTLLFFGFIRDYKGLDILLEAFDKLDSSYQLVIAGEVYGSFDSYQKQIDTNVNKTRIHPYITYIADNEVTNFFSAADVCVLPYKDATQSGITAISYHFNVPIIATNTGGLAEIIHHKQTGLISEEVNSASIKHEIEVFFTNNENVNYETNIISLKEALSWNTFTQKLIDLSKSI